MKRISSVKSDKKRLDIRVHLGLIQTIVVYKSLFNNTYVKAQQKKVSGFFKCSRTYVVWRVFLTKLKGQTMCARAWCEMVASYLSSSCEWNLYKWFSKQQIPAQSVGGIWEQNLGLAFFFCREATAYCCHLASLTDKTTKVDKMEKNLPITSLPNEKKEFSIINQISVNQYSHTF